MIKYFCFFFILLFSLSGRAQDNAVAVVAVGEGEFENEKVIFAGIETENMIGPDQKKLFDELYDLIKNDFAFYKHKLDVVESTEVSKKPVSEPALEIWKQKNAHYVIALKAHPVGASLEVEAHIYNLKLGQSNTHFKVKLNGLNLRGEGHRLADALYQAITGKRSIFMSKIFFVSDRTSRARDTLKELYVMDFDGRRVERLTFFDSTVISPAVSPDNSKVMFSLIKTHRNRGKGEKNIDLLVYDLYSKKVKPVSEKPGINSGAIYSSDGKKIYYTLSISGSADIYELNLENMQNRRITNHYSEDVDPSITKDGNLMSFLSNRAGKANIYIMDPQGAEKDVRRISFVGQFNATPRFSPDGKEIVFASWVDNVFDLYRISSTGDNLSRLTKNFGSNEEPAYSSDGEFIIFTSQRILSRYKATQDIYIMNRNGEVIAQLTSDFGRCFSPRWSN